MNAKRSNGELDTTFELKPFRSHPRRALLTEATEVRDDGGGPDGGQIGEYLVHDPDLINIAQGIGLLVCPSEAERSVRLDTLGVHARGIYPRLPTPRCDRCMDPFLRACWDEPCFYTAIRDVTWPRTAFLIGENRVVTARHSLPVGRGAMDDVRVIFGLTRDKLRMDIDGQKRLTVAKYKPKTYEPGPSGRYDWATFEIEVMTPSRRPLKPATGLIQPWLEERADDGKKYELAMLGHPLGLPLTLVRNESTLTRVPPQPPTKKSKKSRKKTKASAVGEATAGARSEELPEGLLLAAMDSIDGYSGAPVLTQVDGKWHIVGLCVGTAWHEKAADPNVRACALSSGDVVDRNGNGRCRILPAKTIFFKR